MRQILGGGGAWPGGRKWTVRDKFPFFQFLLQLRHAEHQNWERKPSVLLAYRTRTSTPGKWRIRNSGKERATEGEALNSVYKLHPNLWLIPELRVWGADSKSHTKAERSILRFHMIPTSKEKVCSLNSTKLLTSKKKKVCSEDCSRIHSLTVNHNV